MRKSGYLQRQKARDSVLHISDTETIAQYMVDMMTLALNDPKYMGGDAFGYDRIRRIVDGVQEYYNLYKNALIAGPEADYYREKIDEALKRIIKDKEEFQDFEKRYVWIKKIKYKKG